jgi:hypothetical protein
LRDYGSSGQGLDYGSNGRGWRLDYGTSGQGLDYSSNGQGWRLDYGSSGLGLRLDYGSSWPIRLDYGSSWLVNGWITALAGGFRLDFRFQLTSYGLSCGSASRARALSDERVREGLARGKTSFRGP